MEKFVDTTYWPEVCSAKIVCGKYYDSAKAHMVFSAKRIIDKRTGRYFYDLYLKENLYLARVNPLFLEFVHA